MTFEARTEVVNDTLVARMETDDHFDLTYEAMVATADPGNWAKALPSFWLAMIPLGLGLGGWDRYIEHITYGGLRTRVPLRFWKRIGPHRYTINYEIDPDTTDPQIVDKTVTVDQGYLVVQREENGVRVKTSKQLAIAGTSSFIGAKIVKAMGYHTNLRRMITGQANVIDPVPFVASVAPPAWKPFPFRDGDVLSEW